MMERTLIVKSGLTTHWPELEMNFCVNRLLSPVIARPRFRSSVLLMLVLLLTMSCTKAPVLNAIDSSDGYPRQLLAVDGNTLFASVVWDVGLPTETTLYNGLFGTSYFQIPTTATPGVHPVAIRNNKGTSSSVNVTVLGTSGTFPAPRIEDVGILGISDVGGGNIDVAITISAANMDVDATISVNGTSVDSWRWGALPFDYLQDHLPSTYGYPIYHYTQMLSLVENVAFGSNLTVVVNNTDGQTDTKSYTLPSNLANLDSDGDGLLDTWEDGSYTAPGGGTVNISAMGTNKWQKDILVEVDWIAAATPNAAVWATVETAFNDAPVLNPDGSSGINIIIDRGQGGVFTNGGNILADHTTMDFGPSTAAGYTNFFTYKNANFNNNRLNIFHYGVFGRARPGGSSGRGEVWGNDFMVTFRAFAVWPQTIAQVGTFIHELGHNLGLTHGDNNSNSAQWNETRKPNFPTTMSYRYQFPGVSSDCDFTSDGFHTYSQGMYARIIESSVNENIGICDNSPLDMNGDGAISTGSMDTSQDGDSNDTHDDFNQWANILYKFDVASSRWNSN
ncbi:MAG: hypothetical protein D8M58_03065 [Calditrichaeota bacterium]|nr:MAG: hypothetical protein DWQ03_04015 [Calditrichota bacterium]MBL1204346.1 hypothetical protein [Calditrichota bacterium]NOG44175.1 hypothetical protein [Calditrichota bacterium]